MFARHLAKSSGSLKSSMVLSRTFASTAACSKSPSLADITPQGVSSFDAKQRDFRERLTKSQKKKETSQLAADSPSPNLFSTSPHSPTAPNASNASSIISDHLTSGSQSASSVEPDEEISQKTGKLSSLIYGTKEGRQMEQEIEQSFSQVLARGKYVHSIVFHEVKPDKVDEYVELVGGWYPRMASMPENKVNLVGSWRTEVGDCDTFGEHLL
jgi:hypothetical protein